MEIPNSDHLEYCILFRLFNVTHTILVNVVFLRYGITSKLT